MKRASSKFFEWMDRSNDSPFRCSHLQRTRLAALRLTEHQGADKRGGSTERIQLLDEYMRLVADPQNYENARLSSTSAILNKWMEGWYPRASEVFEANELYTILFRLSLDSSYPPYSELTPTSAGKTAAERPCGGCCCNVGSSWTCPKFKISSDNVEIGYGDCEHLGCVGEIEGGCGFGGFHACDGGNCIN